MKKKYTKKQIAEAIAYWENRLKQMNESNAIPETVNDLWDEDGNGGPKSAKEFADFVCSYQKNVNPQSYYEYFVPDEDTEISFQTDVDDFDEYTINFQDTISKDDFWEALYDFAINSTELHNGMDSSNFIDILDKQAEKIAEDAYENYEPNSGQMTWKGGYSRGGRYPDA